MHNPKAPSLHLRELAAATPLALLLGCAGTLDSAATGPAVETAAATQAAASALAMETQTATTEDSGDYVYVTVPELVNHEREPAPAAEAELQAAASTEPVDESMPEAGVAAAPAADTAQITAAPETAQATAADEPQAADDTVKVVEVTSTPQPATYYFATASSRLTASDLTTLQPHADYLLANPQARLYIGGHADSRGSEMSNTELSLKRAQAVAAALLEQGVHARQLQVQGHGEQVPASNPRNWQANRRVELQYLDAMLSQQVE